MRLNNQINPNYYPKANLLNNVDDNETLNGFLYQFKYCHKTKKSFFPYVSKGIETIFGISADVLNKNASSLLATFHTEDVEMIQHKLCSSISNLSNWNLEFRAYIPGKGIIWLRGQGSPKRAIDGSIIWSGYMKDITHLKVKKAVKKSIDCEVTLRNNELLNLANIASHNLFLSYEEFNKLLDKSKKTEDMDEKRKIISCLREISQNFAKDKEYIDEIINANLESKKKE